MPRRIELVPHLSLEELAHRARHGRDPVERRHFQMVELVARGQTCAAVATRLGASAEWVRTIIHRDNRARPDGVSDQRRANPGRRPLLSPALRAALDQALAADPPDGGCGPVPTWRRG